MVGDEGSDAEVERRDAVARQETVTARAEVGPVRTLMRGYFSSYLLWMAQHSSELAGEIEAAHIGESTFNIEHRGFVLSSMFSSAAFLEAMVNELYQDAADEHGLTSDGYLAPLPSEVVQLMAEFWRNGRRLTPSPAR